MKKERHKRFNLFIQYSKKLENCDLRIFDIKNDPLKLIEKRIFYKYKYCLK